MQRRGPDTEAPESSPGPDGRGGVVGRPWVLHPVLFALFPVLYLYAQNLEESIPLADLGEALGPVLLFTLAVWLIGTVATKSLALAGMAASALVLLFFIYGPVQARLEGGVLGRHIVLLPLWGLLAGFAVFLISRIRARARELTIILNVTAAALVVLNLIPVVDYQLRVNVLGADDAPERPLVHPQPIPDPPGSPSDRPDIYYLVFDTYGNQDVLREFFGHDNTPFLEELAARGFYVARQASANYPRSSLSIASSLNLDYLDLMTEWFGRDAGREVHLHDLLQRSRAARFLQSQGYRYVHAGSWWRPTKRSPIAEENLTYGGFSEFAITLFRNSALRPFADEHLWRKHEWSRTQWQLDAVERVAADPRPTFVFAHVMIPHGPQVFNRDGSFVTPEELSARTREDGYLEQLLYANTRILRLLDALLSGPERNRPIVILQADEGPYEGDPSQWRSPVTPGADIDRKFPILNAYHFPDRGYEDLDQAITPVNSFRVLFNRYFGTELPLLRDRNYVFRDYRLGLFDFTEVTDLVARTVGS